MNAARCPAKSIRAAVIVLILVDFGAFAQGRFPARAVEPKWFTMDVTALSTGVYAEGNFETTEFKNSNTSATHNRYFVGPSAGLDFAGTIYHPNLFQYQVTSEGAVGWARDELNSSGSQVNRNELQYLGRFSASGDLLPNKPFHSTIFGDYDHTYRDYDFFTRVTVDDWRYGLRSGYISGPFSLIFFYTRRDENTSGSSGPTSWQQNVIGLSARHDRKSGSTSATYTYDDYQNASVGSRTSGTDHIVTLSDSENIGNNDKYRLTLSSSYSLRESDIEPSDELTAGANFTADHTDRLSTFYDVNYDRYHSGDFLSDNSFAQAVLRHHLYDSLTSTLLGHYIDYENSSAGTPGYTRRIGGSLSEAYTKELSGSARLRFDGSALAEHVDQESTGAVMNEPHTFGVGAPPGSFFLNLPNVDPSSIRVWNVGRTILFVQGIHYTVFQNGSLTQIQSIPASGIPNSVVVDYQAQPTPAGHYESLTDSVGVRLELWNNIWGLYARYSSFVNNAPIELNVPDLQLYDVGTDLHWHWARGGAEYSVYDSTLSSYNAARLYEAAGLNLDRDSSLNLDLSQTWTKYITAHRREEDYRFITQYHRRLSNNLRTTLEGGFDLRYGPGVDQTLVTVRADIDYVIGRTIMKFGYWYEYNVFLENEVRTKNAFVLSIKRVF